MGVATAIKIKDVEEFTKLFKTNIPVVSEFEYYINTLKKSYEFSHPGRDISNTINLYAELEQYISERGYKSVREYKNKCLDLLKDYILTSDAYYNMQTKKMPTIQMVTKNHINQVNEFEHLVSLDFSSANYSVLKTFDEKNELKDSWADLCKMFDVHEALIKSKSFRQIVFGNTNPKRFQTFQHEKITLLLDFFKDKIQEEDIVFISHDEIIFKVKTANQLHYFIDTYGKEIENVCKMPIKFTNFSMKKLKKDTFLKSVYGITPSSGSVGNFYFSEEYKTLHGVSGHKFYMYFKKYVLEQELDERDLMYYNDGELCKWIDESVKPIAKNNTLEHAMSIKEAKEQYSYLWDEMTNEMPDISNEYKRNIIEIVARSCKSCFRDEVGCHCWNDE